MAYKSKTDGSMYVYDSAVATSIDAVDQYHAVQVFGTGTLLNGITFTAGTNGAITDTADNGGTLRCTDASHGLATGQYVTLTGMGDAAHVGSTAVTVIDANTFDCDDISHNSDNDTGNWQRGASLTVDTGHGGDFHCVFSMSFTSAGNNKNYKFELVKNTTDLDEFAAEEKVQTANDLGNASAQGTVVLNGGDVLWLQVENTTDATNLTITHGNVHLMKF